MDKCFIDKLPTTRRGEMNSRNLILSPFFGNYWESCDGWGKGVLRNTRNARKGKPSTFA